MMPLPAKTAFIRMVYFAFGKAGIDSGYCSVSRFLRIVTDLVSTITSGGIFRTCLSAHSLLIILTRAGYRGEGNAVALMAVVILTDSAGSANTPFLPGAQARVTLNRGQVAGSAHHARPGSVVSARPLIVLSVVVP